MSNKNGNVVFPFSVCSSLFGHSHEVLLILHPIRIDEVFPAHGGLLSLDSSSGDLTLRQLTEGLVTPTPHPPNFFIQHALDLVQSL